MLGSNVTTSLDTGVAERGLTPALKSLANRAPFPVEIRGVPSLRLTEALEAAVYFVAAESLTKAAKDSGASEARVELSTTTEAIVVEISDNGSGGAKLIGGSGIRGLADRVEALGGKFELESSVGAGTVVRAELPPDFPTSSRLERVPRGFVERRELEGEQLA